MHKERAPGWEYGMISPRKNKLTYNQFRVISPKYTEKNLTKLANLFKLQVYKENRSIIPYRFPSFKGTLLFGSFRVLRCLVKNLLKLKPNTSFCSRNVSKTPRERYQGISQKENKPVYRISICFVDCANCYQNCTIHWQSAADFGKTRNKEFF